MIMVNNELFPYKIDFLDQKDGVEYVACRNGALVHIALLDKLIHNTMKYPAKLNGFITIICTRGQVTLSVHMTDYTLKQNDVLIAPTAVVEFKHCQDCEIYIAAFNNDFAINMNIDLGVIMPIISSLHSQCIVHTIDNPIHIQAMHSSFASIHREFTQPIPNHEAGKFREMSIRHMYASMIYRLCEFIAHCNEVRTNITQKDRSSDYFKQLIHLLHEHYKVERSVEFYANKMNLTPKHLSRVVRTYSGKSVHQWIDEFVVLEIKNLLKYSDMSIQQISYELNFPNPSFMGQYFKRITGKTPGDYRKEM